MEQLSAESGPPVFSTPRQSRVPVVRVCAGLLAALSLTVMTGWWLHNSTIVRLHQNLPAIQFNTALLFGLCAAALESSRRRAYRVTALLGLIVVAGAGLTVMQGVLGTSFGIDRLFVEPYLFGSESPSGRMAPRAAVAFLCAALAFLVAGVRRARPSTSAGSSANMRRLAITRQPVTI